VELSCGALPWNVQAAGLGRGSTLNPLSPPPPLNCRVLPSLEIPQFWGKPAKPYSTRLCGLF